MKPYPDDPDQIRQILMAHLESPVHWMQNVKTLWEDFGIRHFVEIGPRDTLCNLVGETLEQALCIPTCSAGGRSPGLSDRGGPSLCLGAFGSRKRSPLEAQTARAYRPHRCHRNPIPSEDRVGAIVQREINAFVLESFGKIIKPQIVEAVRRELDPGFTRERLDRHPGRPTRCPRSGLNRLRAMRPYRPATADARRNRAALPLPRHRLSLNKDGQEDVDYLEQVIQIIMNATGYERDEIEPDMDIRQDLAIRSSRLPVIMDDIERQFGITVNVEDFMDKRTVREIATCIERLAGQTGSGDGAEHRSDQPSSAVPAGDTSGESSAERHPFKKNRSSGWSWKRPRFPLPRQTHSRSRRIRRWQCSGRIPSLLLRPT